MQAARHASQGERRGEREGMAMKRETLVFPFILIIIMILLLEAVEVGMLERMGKRVEKLYRYVGCADEEGPTPPWEPKI